jgi:hypothetical protein
MYICEDSIMKPTRLFEIVGKKQGKWKYNGGGELVHKETPFYY